MRERERERERESCFKLGNQSIWGQHQLIGVQNKSDTGICKCAKGLN